jgi:hypothetical protein
LMEEKYNWKVIAGAVHKLYDSFDRQFQTSNHTDGLVDR